MKTTQEETFFPSALTDEGEKLQFPRLRLERSAYDDATESVVAFVLLSPKESRYTEDQALALLRELQDALRLLGQLRDKPVAA